MKEITQKDIDIVKTELNAKRKELEKLNLGLEEKLKWIRTFFNKYVPELEEKYLSEEELYRSAEDTEAWIFLPNELRIWFYIYFPEHGLNMANCSQKVAQELAYRKRFDINNSIAFRHQD